MSTTPTTTPSRSQSPAPATASVQENGGDERADGKQHDPADRSPSPRPTKPGAEDKSSPSPSTSASAASPAPATSTSVSVVNNASPYPSTAPAVMSPTAANGDWQAIWSPAHNAYYFYNAKTQETTWSNPLQPMTSTSASPDPAAAAASASPGPSAPGAPIYDLQAAAAAQGVDPELAYLDPSLVAGPSSPSAYTYAAKFNARTGTFARPDGRDPSHLSEYERAKRMSEFYFDVNAWEREVEARKLEEAHEEESRKRKRPTKKDLDRFREQKKQKKIAKTAWLRT